MLVASNKRIFVDDYQLPIKLHNNM